MTKFLNISTDGTLGGVSPSDEIVASQKAIKTYVDNQGGGGGGAGHNVGDIFFTSRLDSALNGAVECNGGTYDTGNYSGAQSIGALLANGSIPYVSLAQYATLLSTNGSVGVFGWDGIGTTPFRVPSLNDIFLETGTSAQVGDYEAPGSPNITAGLTGIYFKDGSPVASGALSVSNLTNSNLDNTSGTGEHYGNATFNASSSNSIYGNSNTVQPNAVRYRAMVQLVLSATDAAVATCTSVTSQVATNTTDISTLQSNAVVVFQLPTSGNNFTWYIKYSNGFVIQGGFGTTNGGNATPVSLPITMADSNYSALIQGRTAADGYSNAQWQVMPVVTTASPTTTTSFYVQASITGYNLGFKWVVTGMAA